MADAKTRWRSAVLVYSRYRRNGQRRPLEEHPGGPTRRQRQTQGPVYVEHNGWDPLGPYVSARQTVRGCCDKGADVTFWTNQQPPLFNKLDVNAFLPVFVHGERSRAWIVERFDDGPTGPNCAEIQNV